MQAQLQRSMYKILSEFVEFNQAIEKVRAAVAPIEEEIAKMGRSHKHHC